jgi:hypothetical protein
MKRLSKDQKQQRADLVTRLNDAAEAVRAALAAVNAEIAGKLNSAIENYNLYRVPLIRTRAPIGAIRGT